MQGARGPSPGASRGEAAGAGPPGRERALPRAVPPPRAAAAAAAAAAGAGAQGGGGHQRGPAEARGARDRDRE